MKALTVQQPWAWAIFHGKVIENRTQNWHYRGPLAIHAGQRMSRRGVESELVRSAFRASHPESNGGKLPAPAFPLGYILGTVELVDVHPDVGCCKPWGESAYVEHGGRVRRRITHLVLEDPILLPRPIRCTGSLGLWNVPDDVLDQLQGH